jgi:hypothetical protein
VLELRLQVLFAQPFNAKQGQLGPAAVKTVLDALDASATRGHRKTWHIESPKRSQLHWP